MTSTPGAATGTQTIPPTLTDAVAYRHNGPIDADDALVDVQVEVGPLGPHDLLVEVHAVSVNPVDVKVRASTDPQGHAKVLGYDAAGVVVQTGEQVRAFRVGDEVYYAGSITRPGTNARLHVVDERITGRKPATLGFTEAAALPLTTLTAWEALFERLNVAREQAGTLLVVGAAGGVGSMVIQLARRLTRLRVVAAASRAESAEWARQMGAHEVVDHRELRAQVQQTSPQGVDYIFSAYSSGNVATFADVLRVHGAVVAIDDPTDLDLMPLKARSQTWHWESMFTRSTYQPESTAQQEILDEVAALVEAGTIRSTMTRSLHPFTAASLTQAHRLVETSATIGKVVVSD